MGAIAAFLAERGEAQPETVETMSRAAPHRGGLVETLVHGRCALSSACRDDLPDSGLASVDGVAAAFTGTLDNAADLARELERRNVAVPEQSAAGLVAAAFRLYGEELPARLRGVFAGAVTDGDRLICFRDHLGYAPLFYRADARGFLAATEAKQVIAGAGIRREPDLEVVERIFYKQIDDETPSAVRGVHRLPKSTLITAGEGLPRRRRYWEPEAVLETATLSEEDVQARFDELMDQAVTRSLTGNDVVSLSGGIDSPAVAAYAAPRHVELAGEPLHAVSVVYPRYPSVDERRYVELLAGYFALPLHTHEQHANALDRVAEWTALADTPYQAAALAQYEEDYRAIRELGFRTVLTGEHAEFVFALQWHLLDHYLTHLRLAPARRELAARRARGASWRWLARETALALAPHAVLKALARRRPALVPDWIDAGKAVEEEPVPARQRWRNLQLSAFIGPGISVEAEEVCQAACGVRTRRPWADVDLWELFLSLPAEQKFPDLRNKSLVRRLLRGRVPDEILDRRRKTVFNEAMLAEIDWDVLRRFLVDPEHRLAGVDYERLRERLERRDLEALDYRWARNLATMHAFLSQW